MWNHVEWFPFKHTWVPDGFPYFVWKPRRWEVDVRENVHARRLLGWTDEDVRLGKVGPNITDGQNLQLRTMPC